MHAPNTIPLTLKGVSEALSQITLPTQKRRELRSAITSFARACDRTPEEIIADAPHINYLLQRARWQCLGISKRSWSNVQSRLRTAMQLAGVDIVKRRNFKLSSEWQQLLAPLPFKRRQDLSRFAGFCTLREVLPHDVNEATFAEFLRFNIEQIIQRDARERWQAARRAWNHLADLIQTPNLPIIPNIGTSRWTGLSWAELPPTLRREIEALREWLIEVPDEEHERDAVKPVTADNYTGNLRRYVSHLFQMGVAEERLQTLESILAPELVKVYFRQEAAKRGLTKAQLKQSGDPSLHAYMAALMAAARFVGASADQWKTLVSIGKQVRPKQWELSSKNRERIRTLSDPWVELRYLNLPLTIAARHETITQPSILQALEMQAAAALEFLIKAPLRIENLAALDLDRHIHRPAAGASGKWLVNFDAHEVKNNGRLDFELGETTSALLNRYLAVFRPVLLRKGPSSAFFVTKDGNPKCKHALRKQLKKLLLRELGLTDWSPHTPRSHSGWMMLEDDPGNFRAVQMLLGHRRPETTASYYLQSDRERAFRELDELIEQRRSAQDRL